MKKIEILSIHNLFYFLFILVLIFGFTTIVDLRPNSQTQTGNAISGEWTSYTSAFSGSGTESDPYKIASAENLAYLASQVNSGTTYSGSFFRQTANIDLSAHYWVPIGIDSTIGFAGTYDGDGHTISKMTFNKLYDHTMALFGKLGDGLITNLGVIDTAFPTNITAEVDNALETIGIANIVGSSNGNSGDIINCYSSADIDINVNVNINIDSTDISGTLISCNIAGINAGACSASNCYNTGDIKVSVTNSNPNFSLQLYIEGIGATSHNCYNTGSIDCEMNGKYGIVYIAGIGDLGDNCFNAGNIDINANNSTISTLYIGGVFHYSYSYGGIIGQDNTSTYSGLYNKGNIYYTGATGSTNVYIGGIGGSLGISKGIFIYPKKYLSNTFNLGNITTNKTSANVGGILGRTDNNGATLGISNCQNTGQVSGEIAGGIAGYVNGGSFSNCIYGGNCTLNYGIGSSSSNSGCTKQSNLAIDMSPQVQSWYTSNSNWNTSYPWDFEDTWMINSGLNDGYPVFQWQLNQLEYIINLNANGGTLNIGGQTTVPYGSSYTMPSTSSVTRTGYTLTGWKAVIENSTYTYTPGQIITIPTWSASQTTVTFYAQWSVNTYTVSFDNTNYIAYPPSVNFHFNGISGIMSTRIENNESITSVTITSSPNNDAAQGFYIAMGKLTVGEKYTWSVDIKSTHSHLLRIGQEQGGNLTNYFSVTTSWQTLTWTYTATEPRWTAFEFYRGSGNWVVGEVFEFKNLVLKKTSDTVTDQVVPTKSYTFDQYYTNLPTPTRYGYNFTGWYTSASSGSQVTSSTQVKTANNHTLYSRWTAKTDCVLTFNANGGTVSPASRNQTFNTSLGTLPVPTRTGYIFTGWYTSASGGDEVTSSTIMKSESMTIYAHWAETWAASHYSSALTQNGGYWLISDSADLARLLYLLNYTTRTDVLTMRFKLTDHIDMSAYYWEPIGTESRAFQGEFNGQGYTIKGLHTISQSLRRDGGGDNSGLFGVTSTGAIIKNVYLEELDIHGLDRVGAIVGYVKGTTTITAVAVEGTVTASGSNYGAIVGSSSTCTINDCLIIVDGIKGGNNNGLYSGTATITNTLYDISGLRGRSSGTFDNWVYVTNMQYPLPKEISWIASGSEPIEDNVLALSTANNLVQCGDMEGRGWQVNNGTVAYSSEDVYEGEYSIKLTGDTSKSEQTVTTSDTYYLNSDHIYYFAIFVKSSLSSNARVDIYWPVAEPGMGAQYITIANSWQMYSWKVSRNSFTSGEYPLRVDFDNNYQNGTMYIDNLILLDLTEIFGAGNEPDKAWIDKNLAIVSIDGITSEQYTFLSAQNLYQYGDMEGEGWTTNSSVQYSTEHVFTGNYALKLTGTSSSQEILAQTSETLELDPTHIYYVSVYGYQESKDGKESVECYWPVAEPVMGGIAVGAVGEWNLYSWRATRTSFTSGSYQLRLDFNNKLCNSTFYFDNLRIIDLTATFGEGNEPDKSWLDANAYLLL